MKKKKLEKHIKKAIYAFCEKEVKILDGYSINIVRSRIPRVFDVEIKVSFYDEDIKL